MRTWLTLLVLAYPLIVTAAPASERNIVLFVTDDESLTLGCYGDPVAKTPIIDALASDGTRFNNAFATTASCSASRSVILTGLHNHTNGQYGHQHHFHKFACYHNCIELSLPYVLSNNGYRTARIGKFHVAPEKVFPFDAKIIANARNPVLMADACKSWIAKDERPFFLYFCTSDPHRSGAVNRRSDSEFKPNLFGNKPNQGTHFEVNEVFYDPSNVPVPRFLPDTPETREELAQYYQSVSRIDQGLGQLIKILKEAGQYEKTLIVFTSDHGMAFAGAKTTVYEPGLRVPMVVRNPYNQNRGIVSDALISHIDITPSLVDFAKCLDEKRNRPKTWKDPDRFWRDRNEDVKDNRSGGNQFREFQGKSWLSLLGNSKAEHNERVFASHTFHEIQMYYPMRVIRDKRYKLIWNIAHKLEFPFASDLWDASSWQAQYQKGARANYGKKTVSQYLNRAEFELFDMVNDPNETTNLALESGYLDVLEEYKQKLREMQMELSDPWIRKWDHE